MAIGGADMPVVASMRSSYSGWAAAATGFMPSKRSADRHGGARRPSGAILSYIIREQLERIRSYFAM